MTDGLETKLIFPPTSSLLAIDQAQEQRPRHSRSQHIELLVELAAGFSVVLPSGEDQG